MGSIISPSGEPLYMPPAKKRMRTSQVLGQTATYVLLGVFSIAFLFPFLWMLSTALKPNWQVSQWPIQWIPHPFLFGNFVHAFTVLPFGQWFINSCIITGFTILGTLLSCTVVAYGFARFRAPGRDVLFVILLATMMLPSSVTVIPMFEWFRDVHWINTFLPLIVPQFFGNAFFIFLLRQFFMTIPVELEESAKIDGLGTMGTLLQIILPLTVPALATVAVMQFNGTWNDFFNPLIYLDDPSKYTLAIGINFFKSEQNVQWNYLMAASSVIMLPSLILFFVGQRFYVESITLTGVKG